ncbi:MAG TPA: hypothetical protein VJM46_01060 [Candidatus Saccharimonadales bacterium]|nr:hypothetical protein [Candidatus Saccharimonadales bacterium]
MRYVIGLSFAALAVWVLQATGILMGFLMFLMIGTVPGTRISVPPEYMLGLVGLVAIGVIYWLLRERPAQQIADMKRAYHAEVDDKPKPVATAKPARRDSLFMAGFHQSYRTTEISTRQWRYRTIASASSSANRWAQAANKATQPARALIAALFIILAIAAQEITTWARPHINRIAAWVKLQATYSLKGTMLSAHKWSSLSKKLLSSLTSLLKRCSSVLKRGKSLLIRSDR